MCTGLKRHREAGREAQWVRKCRIFKYCKSNSKVVLIVLHHLIMCKVTCWAQVQLLSGGVSGQLEQPPELELEAGDDDDEEELDEDEVDEVPPACSRVRL